MGWQFNFFHTQPLKTFRIATSINVIILNVLISCMSKFILDCQPTTIKLINLFLFRIHHGGVLFFFFLSIIYLSHKKKQVTLWILKYMSQLTITRMQINDFDNHSFHLKMTEPVEKEKKSKIIMIQWKIILVYGGL